MNDDDETQPIILRNLRDERMVVERLRAALPPPARLSDIDFLETGGSALPGDEREVDDNEPLVRFASTTETVDDGGGAIGGTTQGTVEGALTLTAAAEATGGATGIPGMPRMCINHERCGHVQAITMCVNPAYCCDECAYTNGREYAEHCYADQITESHAPGTVEGALTLEATVGLADGHGGAAPLTVPNLPALCPNSNRCHQAANLADGLEHCCERCFRTNATEHSEDCRWWHTTSSGTVESTLNDLTPAPMYF